jgi:hypothetical protein
MHADILPFLFVNTHHITVRPLPGKPAQWEPSCAMLQIPHPKPSSTR